MAKKAVKTVVNIGGGPPPGYLWSVVSLDAARAESEKIFDQDQYDHLAAQVRELAAEAEPSRCPTVDVRPVRDFLELRDKGGVLGKINARVFFFVHDDARTIVILGTINKKNDGATPLGTCVVIGRRMRLYLEQHPKPSPPHSD